MTTQNTIPAEWVELARKTAVIEQVYSVLKQIRKIADDAQNPLDALEQTVNIEQLAARCINLIRGFRKGRQP